MPSDLKSQAVLASCGGLLATVLDAGLLLLLVEAGCPVGPAALLAASAGAVFGFGFNRRVAFSDRSPLRWQQAASATLVAVVGAIAMAVSMHIAVELGGLPTLLAKALCALLVFLLWSLPAQRYLVFPTAFARSTATGSL